MEIKLKTMKTTILIIIAVCIFFIFGGWLLQPINFFTVLLIGLLIFLTIITFKKLCKNNSPPVTVLLTEIRKTHKNPLILKKTRIIIKKQNADI